MTAAPEFEEIADEEFSSPYPAVCSVAGTVERHPDYRAVDSVVGHATCDVRMVMLNSDCAQPRLEKRVAGAQIARVQVVSHGNRRDVEEALQVLPSLAEEGHGFEIFEISDVLAQDGIAVLCQAQRILEFAPTGKYFDEGRASGTGSGA